MKKNLCDQYKRQFYPLIEMLYLFDHKELQIYVSCFNDDPEINFFKKNILIGNSRIKNKEQFDVFIPSSIPGVDQDGLVVRSDGVCIQKLKKKTESDFKSVKEIFHIFNY